MSYLQGQNFWEYEVHRVSQTSEEPQQTQGQTTDTQTTAPAKGKKMRAGQEQTQSQAKPETGTNVRGQSNVKGRAQEINRNQATRSTRGSDERRNHKSDHHDG